MKTLRLGTEKLRCMMPGESAPELSFDRRAAERFLRQVGQEGGGLQALRKMPQLERQADDEEALIEEAARLLAEGRLRLVQLSPRASGMAGPTVPEAPPEPTPPDTPPPRPPKKDYRLVKVLPSAASRWHVNLAADAAKEQGREVKIEAHVTPAAAGVSVTFALEAHGSNTAEAKLSASQKASLAATSATTDASGVARVTLKLSTCGLDRFRVVGSLEGVKKRSGWVQVWRKLYYQQSRMKASYSFPFGSVTGEYENHGVELASSGAVVEATHKENLETAELRAYARTYHKKRQQPFEAHILLIDRQCDSRTETVSQAQTVASKDYSFTSEVWPFSGWLVSARWRKTGDATYSNTGISVTRGTSKITVDLAGTGVDATAQSVDIDVTVKLIKGEYTGDATYKPHMFIATGSPRSDASKSKTVNHEVGHGVGMVPTSDHDLQYDNANGGMGSHCREGASPDQKSQAQGGTFAGRYSGGTCVMYHASSEHHAFCATCALFVKKAEVAEADMKGRGWGS